MKFGTFPFLGQFLDSAARINDDIHFALTKASILTLEATRTRLPYRVMSVLAGYGERDNDYHHMLERLMEEDHNEGLPLRSALVVHSEKVFCKKARELGYKIPNNQEDEISFHRDQLTRLGVTPPDDSGFESKELSKFILGRLTSKFGRPSWLKGFGIIRYEGNLLIKILIRESTPEILESIPKEIGGITTIVEVIGEITVI